MKALRQSHLDQGSWYVVQTEFDGKVWLRCTLMNPLTSESDMSQMLDEMEARCFLDCWIHQDLILESLCLIDGMRRIKSPTFAPSKPPS